MRKQKQRPKGCAHKPRKLPETRSGKERFSSYDPEGVDLRFLAFRALRKYTSVVLNQPVCGGLFPQPQETSPEPLLITFTHSQGTALRL